MATHCLITASFEFRTSLWLQALGRAMPKAKRHRLVLRMQRRASPMSRKPNPTRRGSIAVKMTSADKARRPARTKLKVRRTRRIVVACTLRMCSSKAATHRRLLELMMVLTMCSPRTVTDTRHRPAQAATTTTTAAAATEITTPIRGMTATAQILSLASHSRVCQVRKALRQYYEN